MGDDADEGLLRERVASSFADWHVVIPVKRLDGAKTRLGPLAADQRAGLAWAFAQDTLATVLRVVGPGRTVVVTGEPRVADRAITLGASHVSDPGLGLNAAVAAGLDRWGTSVSRAVILADLPALDAESLRSGLRACAAHPSAVVADAEGLGTVLLSATAGSTLTPRFGGASAAAHAAEGATLLSPDLPRLRRDVDDVEGLRQALALGLAPASAGAVASLCWPDTGDSLASDA